MFYSDRLHPLKGFLVFETGILNLTLLTHLSNLNAFMASFGSKCVFSKKLIRNKPSELLIFNQVESS